MARHIKMGMLKFYPMSQYSEMSFSHNFHANHFCNPKGTYFFWYYQGDRRCLPSLKDSVRNGDWQPSIDPEAF